MKHLLYIFSILSIVNCNNNSNSGISSTLKEKIKDEVYIGALTNLKIHDNLALFLPAKYSTDEEYLNKLQNLSPYNFNPNNEIHFNFMRNRHKLINIVALHNKIKSRACCSICKEDIERKYIEHDFFNPNTNALRSNSPNLLNLPCDHFFHFDCLIQWFKMRPNQKYCPTCRKEISQYTRNHYIMLSENPLLRGFYKGLDNSKGCLIQ